jgi:hypothetical protein
MEFYNNKIKSSTRKKNNKKKHINKKKNINKKNTQQSPRPSTMDHTPLRRDIPAAHVNDGRHDSHSRCRFFTAQLEQMQRIVNALEKNTGEWSTKSIMSTSVRIRYIRQQMSHAQQRLDELLVSQAVALVDRGVTNASGR